MGEGNYDNAKNRVAVVSGLAAAFRWSRTSRIVACGCRDIASLHPYVERA
jgi:hypothetical protein